MKKISFIALGLCLVVSSVVSLSQASRDAYHAYLSQKEAQKKNFDNKEILNIREYGVRQSKSMYQTRQEMNTRLFRNSAGRMNESVAERMKRAVRERFSAEPQYSRRVFADRKNPWRQPLKVSEYAPVSRVMTQTSTYNLVTYQNSTFSIQIPEGWMSARDDEHTFINPPSDYTISVERMDDPCSNRTFTECAINLSKALNNENKKELLPLSRISRLYHFSNTVLQSRIQTETMMEGFSANIFGEEKYISRYYVSDLNGNVYLITTEVPIDDAGNYIQVTKRIFDSFQILSDERNI